MKILVTGGCGFVGANICIHLKKQGFIVSLWIISLEMAQNRISSF